ncbi:MAG TPA: hypothetical protein VIV11_03175 [Kofleriaceae bacterium]
MLAKALELGGCGVQWEPPRGTIVEHGDHELTIRDDSGLEWRARLTPIVFGIAPGEETALAEDLHASAHALFERQWRDNPNKKRARPRTDDTSWTPIIEAKVGAIDDGRIARVVRRLSYEPGDESIVGHLIVPVVKGTVEIRVMCQATMTGARESAVIARLGGDKPQAQAVYDARELDPYFPDHPLSRVRAALDESVARLEIVYPAERATEVSLREAGCAIEPPPRFTRAPVVAGSGTNLLVRAGLDDWRRELDVWRIGRHKLKGKDLHKALVEHADAAVADWVKADRTHVITESAPIDDYGVCLQVEQYVTFQHGGDAKHTLHRWWIAGDQTLWRIASGGPRGVERAALQADLEQVQRTFQRI